MCAAIWFIDVLITFIHFFFLLRREVGEEEARILARFLNFNDGIYVEVSYKDQTAVQTVFSTAVQSAYFGHRVKSKKHTRLLEPEKEIYDVTNLEQPSK